ncbi:MAG TPA: hypothetical protein VKA63_09440 [Candidatus Krumholzibacteria bacterium]|nr:hypothetical protein [Candidatus Krumholzibacteria bacterium]
MRHIDRLIQEDPKLRQTDYQRLVQKAKQDPRAHWAELVRVSAPVVYTMAERLGAHLPEGGSVTEEVTRQVFERIADDDFAIVRNYVGFGKWTSLLLRLTQESPLLAQRRQEREWPQLAEEGPVEVILDDRNGSIPELLPKLQDLCDQEGERFLQALWKALRTFHRRDRLLLGMRYEQGLSLKELDMIFRLGTPERVASLLARLRDSLQPFTAVRDAWEIPGEQEEALLRYTLGQLFRARSLATHEHAPQAPAVPTH